MTGYRKQLGAWGEELAVKFLRQRGYTIIAQNFASRYGEIDIIAFDPRIPDTLCMLEVKTRVSTDFGPPEEAITPNKIKRLHDTACSYFFQHRIEDRIFRLDAISILLDPATRRAKIKHIKGINFES
ncbi:MAG: hypothetical protein A2445_05390 [Candidatus Jacksonbacteria bacterium RIFOXYC2_FULL_44_29]|nr:MAG: hypothetical protein UW45_C0030G0014 [Parcubacteria group bacterium GW2011_GWC2_44_22]OGY76192.1 MAG: hypothetical protein A2240_04890 [Candidatus Jacksonbacteria bacterium RIFOXYA2_FULL_43_12]OGY77910.1 MAG: hypothetical protein A2295_04560 [Candidatus Jacksonbacteria bacterium RIFOXYB2_FULL_44_15]OGY78708.1 MAG: hypothetical protein A2550_04280 [Candidatus Jacksonbacteria bacterium RIFOXYD2_FULL_43_21]OGY80279.1 MAG: hypothetical protein A2445_05390 [Candidatus Jacksonbacteria bacteri